MSANSLYGGTYNLFVHTLPRFGLDIDLVDPVDPENFRRAIKPTTKLLYAETVGNPKLDTLDIEAVAAIAHEAGIPLIVDNTMATPYLIRPIDHGADIVVHSATKFIGGHGTSIGGVVVDSGKFDWAQNDKFPGLVEPDASYHGLKFFEALGPITYIVKLRVSLLRDVGAALSPFNAFLFLQGARDAAPAHGAAQRQRLRRGRVPAGAPQGHLGELPGPGVPPHARARAASTTTAGCSGRSSGFGIAGGREAGRRFVESTQLLSHLANIGDAKSLAIHPATTTHSQLTAEEQLETRRHRRLRAPQHRHRVARGHHRRHRPGAGEGLSGRSSRARAAAGRRRRRLRPAALARDAPAFARIIGAMTEKKPAARKEIGDVAMGYDDDAGNAGIVRTRYATFDQPGQELALEGGGTLAPFTLAYETYGTLSERKDNAVLVTHALSGDAHVAGRHSANDKRPGWWDMMIGPGKGLDTDKYFVICANVIGGCSGSTGPASEDPATGKPYGTDFPMITITDMVNAQMRLLDHLGIGKLLAAVGGSMGGMQVLELAISHPDRTHLCVPLATAARQPTRRSPSTRSAARRSWPTPTGAAATTTAASRRPRA